MTDRILQLADQVFRLVFVIRNVAYHRSLHKYKDEFEQNYWILIYNNFLDISVLEWSKVFGSKSNSTHWSNHVGNEKEFRSELLEHLNLSETDWEYYWGNIKNYRDRVVAHHAHDPGITTYPEFNHALSSCYFYYQKLIEELRFLNVYDYPDNLEEYYQSCIKQAAVFSETAYDSTREIKESVY